MQKLEPFTDFAQHTRGDQPFTLSQLELFEHVEGFADGKVHVFRNTASLHADSETFRLEAFPFTRRTFAQCAERLEILLYGPRALLVAPTQVRNHTFEVTPKWI